MIVVQVAIVGAIIGGMNNRKGRKNRGVQGSIRFDFGKNPNRTKPIGPDKIPSDQFCSSWTTEPNRIEFRWFGSIRFLIFSIEKTSDMNHEKS